MTDTWTCPECGEEQGGIDAKVPGGCLNCVDLVRYIEYEAPGMGIVENEVSEVVCFNDQCDDRIEVDPATLVEEESKAVSIESKIMDMQTGERTGGVRVEIYCSSDCRNDQYSIDA